MRRNTSRYYVNKPLPFVFSGVINEPKTYGFEGSSNNAGVLEQEHFVESVKLLRAIMPGVKRIAAVFDNASMWDPVKASMKERMQRLTGVEMVAWDTIETFAEYRHRIAVYQGKADAIGLIGIFNFKDDGGKNVPYQDALIVDYGQQQTSGLRLPVDRVYFGTLCAVTVSERDQGLAAGRIARAILFDGKSSSTFPMKPTVKGAPVISLARADKLGIEVKSGLLLAAEVVKKFDWDK